MPSTRHPWLRGGAVFMLIALLILSSVGAAAHASPTGRAAVAGRASRATAAVPLRAWTQLPAGLAPVVWRTLARGQAAATTVRRAGRDYVSANPAQGLRVHFTAGGPRLSAAGAAHATWGMQLVGYGRGRLQSVASGTPLARGATLSYRRGDLTEWYRNDARGLEQGFTLAARPAGPAGQPVVLVLRMPGTLRARLATGGAAVDLVAPDGATIWRYGGLRATDARGRALAAHMGVRESTLRLVVEDRGAAYPVRIDPYVQQAELARGAGAQGGVFGISVALAADGSTALVGAYYIDSAYVFVRSGTSWTQQAELTANDAAQNDQFGYSVALAGDGSMALVGAYGMNTNTGAAYVFVRSGTSWTQQAELSAGDAVQYENFGYSVALAGDGSMALVGAVGAGIGGAAYVFVRSGTSWTKQAELTASDGAQGDGFGDSVEFSGDGSAALVGAWAKTNYTGAAYVFVRSGTSWTQQAELTASDGVQYDNFGLSVGLAADGSTALVGANYKNTDAGAAYVFVRSGTSWTQQAELTASDAVQGDQFGYSVALAGDGSMALVGAWSKNSATGAAYVFVRSGTSWTQQTELTASDGAQGDAFGDSVVFSGDGSTALVGADGKNTGTGAAYVFVSQQHATSTGVRCAPNPVTAGTPTTCTATVADTAGGTPSTPSGTVSFSTSGSGTFGTGGSCTLAPTAPTGAASCAVTYAATKAGTAAITASYGGDSTHATSSGNTQVGIVAGPPAALALTSASQTQTVNAQACLQATEADRYGNAVPHSPVLFAVSGVNRASGSQRTNASGQATFCYSGLLAGADTVTATADPNHTGQPRPGEPHGAAGVTWILPASTPWCSVLMRGAITAADGDSAIFAGLGTLQATGAPRGYVRYSDAGPAQRLSISAPVQALVCNSAHTQADLYGTTPINGGGSYAYRVEVVVGPTGTATYSLLLSSGYSSGAQVVRNGAVRISTRLS
jgi:hypothetical protein